MYFEKFCKTCPTETHCCIFDHSGFTFVGIDDAKRIHTFTGKAYSEFLDYSPLAPTVVKQLSEDDPARESYLRYSQLDSKKRILRLKKQANGKCIFLTDKGKCGIYPVRPNICQMYPFWGVRLLDGNVRVIGHDAVATCPIVKSIIKKNVDVEKCLSANQVLTLKKNFEDIEKEDISYRRNITEFVKLL